MTPSSPFAKWTSVLAAAVASPREDHGAYVLGRRRLEEVRAAAGAVADVVDPPGRRSRGLARVVLGDAGLDLAHQVGAHVGGLGEMPPPSCAKSATRLAPEAVADDERGIFFLRHPEGLQQDEEPAHAEQAMATTKRPDTAPPRSAS